MKKIFIVVMLLLSVVACGNNTKKVDLSEMYLYGEKSLGETYSPVELTEKEISIENGEAFYYTKDRTTILSFQMYGANLNYEVFCERVYIIVARRGYDELTEETFEKDGHQYYMFNGYLKETDEMHLGIYFSNSHGGVNAVDFQSSTENGKLFLAAFKEGFKFEEMDAATYQNYYTEKEYATVIGETIGIGNAEQGYTEIPGIWFEIPGQPNGLIQFGDVFGTSFVNLMTIPIEQTKSVKIDELVKALKGYAAENTTTFDRDDIVIGDYEIHAFTQYFHVEDIVLTVIVFDRNDGKRQYLSIEGPIWVINYLEDLVTETYSETK